MGLNIRTLCQIILGFGLGVLAVSCLVVTVCFGGYANNYTGMDKISNKLSFSNASSKYSCSIAIAVLGCIATVAAIAAIAFSIIMKGQTLILIIVGGVSALFAFGCIVAEGIFTLKTVKTDSENSYDDHSHKKAQDYIIKAIEELYKQGKANIEEQYNLKDLPGWDEVKNRLGSSSADGHIYTYNDIWSSEKTGNITLSSTYGLINAEYSIYENNEKHKYKSTVASLQFYHKGSAQINERVCWFIKDDTEFKCTNIKGNKTSNCEKTYSINSDYFFNEYIVVGKYYSKQDIKNSDEHLEVDYEVKGFPFAYRKLTYEEIKAIQDQLIDKEDIDIHNEYQCTHRPFSFEDSTNSYLVSGKKYAKVMFNDWKKESKNPEEDSFLMALKKPKDKEDYEKNCEEYNRNKEDEDYNEKERDKFICNDEVYIGNVFNYIQNNYKDSNKGKTSPFIRKYYEKNSRSRLNTIYRDNHALYSTALINLIIQIVGILLWACGRFLGLVLGGGDGEKTASDGEAI